MARTYEIKEASLTAGAMSSVGPRSINNGQIATFKILVGDDVLGLVPADVDEQQVIEDTAGLRLTTPNGANLYQIPKMNEDVLTETDWDTGEIQIQPWMYCTSKRCQRDPQQRFLFHMTCEFSTGNRRSLAEDELYMIDAVDTWLELPYIQEQVYTMLEVPIWEDPQTTGTPPNPTQFRLPTGNQFAEPFMTKIPKRTIRQTQFEEISPANDEEALHTAIQDRLYTVPVDNWPVDHCARPEGEPPRWMIMAIDYQKTRLRNPAGSWLEGYMMTYTLDYKPPVPASEPRDGGFWDRRALIDNYENLTADDPNSRAARFDDNGGNAIITGPINEDGTRRDFSDPFVYKDFKVQREIGWYINLGNGFLRSEAPPQPPDDPADCS